jgi:hypothetical protein
MNTSFFIEQAVKEYLDIKKSIGFNPRTVDRETEASLTKTLNNALKSVDDFFLIPIGTDSSSFWSIIQNKSFAELKASFDLLETQTKDVNNLIDKVVSSEFVSLEIYSRIVNDDKADHKGIASEKIEEWRSSLTGKMNLYFGLIRKLGESFEFNRLSKDIDSKIEEVKNSNLIKLQKDEERKKRIESAIDRFNATLFDQSLGDMINRCDVIDAMLKQEASILDADVPVYFTLQDKQEDFMSRLS